jgi:hypothetical protein
MGQKGFVVCCCGNVCGNHGHQTNASPSSGLQSGIDAGQLIVFKGGGSHIQIDAPSVVKKIKTFSISSLVFSPSNSGLIFFRLLTLLIWCPPSG